MTQTTEHHVSVRTAEGLLHLTLDAGKGNVIDRGVIGELRDAVAEAPTPSTRAILLDHEGPHFSFGASVQEHLPALVGDMLPEFHELARELLMLDLPVLAVVRGACLGGGLEFAALADRIFASPDAKLGQPEIALGVFAPLASALLPRLVGPRVAADLLLSGRSLCAEEALRVGLIGEIADDPRQAALAYYREHLASKSASSLRHATRAARATWLPSFVSDLDLLEKEYLDELMETHDAVEGIEAFLEKREPKWEDR